MLLKLVDMILKSAIAHVVMLASLCSDDDVKPKKGC